VKERRRPLGAHLLAALVAGAALLAGGVAAADPGAGGARPPAAAKKAGPDAAKGRPPAALPPLDKPGKDDAKAAGKEASVEERALRGVVSIERGGQALALGGVLSGDGRVLTALSPLGHGNDLEVRFADGSAVKVKLGHHDRTWDLALLVPQTGKWKDGLLASSKDPVRQDATIRSFTLAKGKIGPTPLMLRSHRTLIGGDDRALDNAIELGSRVSPGDLGSPIVDEDGGVVAVLVRGCAPNDKGPCTPVAFGAPIAAVKAFLRSVPPTAAPPSAWLGIQGVAESTPSAKGVRILVVHSDSPAEEAHLKAGDRSVGDVILAVDGTPVTTPEALSDAVRAHAVGEKVPLTVFGQGRYRQVLVTLRPAPDAQPASAAPSAHAAELPPQNDAPPAKR
jgi:serine protease Do